MITPRHIAFAAAASLSVGQFAAGDLLIRDSADFVNQGGSDSSTASYEATTIPQNATPGWSGPGDSPSGSYAADGELTLTTMVGNNRYFNTGTSWSDDVARNTGYTVEFRMRVDEITDTQRGPALFRVADGVQLVELEWRANQVVWNATTGTAASVIIDPTVYHTYRIAYDPSANDNAGAYAAWIDGELISEALAGNNTTVNYVLFGDTSNSRYGGTTTWDYVRWDTTGAYAPIPEPASLAMLVLGSTMLLRRP